MRQGGVLFAGCEGKRVICNSVHRTSRMAFPFCKSRKGGSCFIASCKSQCVGTEAEDETCLQIEVKVIIGLL